MDRRIDHLVLAVHDLEGAAAFYRRLGFQVGARNRHPWGTENHVIQFMSSFLELITVADTLRVPPHAPRSFSFGAFVRDYLSARQGLAMLALDSTDAGADADAYSRQGIGDFDPFSFERSGRAADGAETHLAFTLAFASDDRLPEAAFFTCQQHYPDAFWSPLLQRHSNGATNVCDVTVQLPHPDEHTDFLQAFTGVRPSKDRRQFHLDRGGRLKLEATAGQGGFAGFSVDVPDIHAVVQRLTAENIPFQGRAHRIMISPDQAFGVQIEFAADTIRAAER